jgi:hypothetical protein
MPLEGQPSQWFISPFPSFSKKTKKIKSEGRKGVVGVGGIILDPKGQQ